MGDHDHLSRYADSGDAESFRALVDQHQPQVRAACARVLRDPAAVDDAVQETFWALARKAREVRANLGGWLHACATNTALGLRRSALARQAREAAAAPPDSAPSQSWSDLHRPLEAALAELEPDLRVAVERHYLHGETLAAIGADLGLSPVAVHKRVQRGLAQLRLRLGPAAGEDPGASAGGRGGLAVIGLVAACAGLGVLAFAVRPLSAIHAGPAAAERPLP